MQPKKTIPVAYITKYALTRGILIVKNWWVSNANLDEKKPPRLLLMEPWGTNVLSPGEWTEGPEKARAMAEDKRQRAVKMAKRRLVQLQTMHMHLEINDPGLPTINDPRDEMP